jgi:hypothetical protein
MYPIIIAMSLATALSVMWIMDQVDSLFQSDTFVSMVKEEVKR